MKIGTFCTGIDAAGVAMAPLGAESVYMAEIEPYPSAVLAYRHGASRPLRMPDPADAATPKEAGERRARIKALDRVQYWGDRIVNYGDITQIVPEELPFCDLLVAGCPCQAFSIAGLRLSLKDARGNLTLYFVKLVHELVRLGRIRSILYENVPALLNTADNAFGAFLGGLVGHDAPLVSSYKGGRWTNAGVVDGPLGTASWRVLDAQYSGLAQRRERVFVVASFGDGPDPVEILFERRGLSRNPPPRRQAGEGIAPTLAARSKGGGGLGTDFDSDGGLVTGPQRRAAAGLEIHAPEIGPALKARDFKGPSSDGEVFDASEDGSGRGMPLVPVSAPVAFAIQAGAVRENPDSGPGGVGVQADRAYTLEARAEVQSVAYCTTGNDGAYETGGLVGAPATTTDPNTQIIAFTSKDYGGDAGPLSPTLRSMGHAGSHQNGGGQVAVAIPINVNALRGDSVALTPSVDAAGRVRLRHPGLGVGDDGDPFGTITAGGPGAVAFSLRGREGGAMPEVEVDGLAPALRAAEGGSTRPFIAFDETQITSAANRSSPRPGDPCHPLASQARPPTLAGEMAVRRITCVEAERLQGFDDNYTLIPWPTANRKGDELAETVSYLMGHGYGETEATGLAQTPDGPRYKAIGNSKAVPLVRQIGAAYQAALSRYLNSEAAA